MGQNSGKFQPLALTALGLLLLSTAPAQACNVIGMVGSECPTTSSSYNEQNPNHGNPDYSFQYDKYNDIKLSGGNYNPEKSGIAAQIGTASSIATDKGAAIKTESGGNLPYTDRDTGKTGIVTNKWYSDGSMVKFLDGVPVAEYANAVQKNGMGTFYGTGTKIATFAQSTTEVMALNKLNGIATGVSSIVNQGKSAFSQIQNVIDNPDAVAKHVQDQLLNQATSYARNGIENMAAQAGLGSLANLKNMSNFDLVTLANSAKLPISELTNGVNPIDLLNGSVARITDLGAVSGLLNKIPGMSGAGGQLASIFKGDFSNIGNLNGSQLAGALGMDASLLQGFSQADIGKLLGGNIDMLGKLGADGLGSFMNLDSALGQLNPDQFKDFLGGDLSGLAGLGSADLGSILGIDSEYLSSLDTSQLGGLLGGEYGSLLTGGDIGSSFADIGSTFSGSIPGSEGWGSFASGGASSFLGGGGGGASGLFGGGSSGGGSGRGTAPLVPHGG